jgi:hypothetical protein
VTGGSLRETKFGVYHAAHLARCSSASDPDFVLNDAKRFTLVEPTQKGYSQSIRNYGN